MNSVNLIGRATREPEVREVTSGSRKFKVAVTGIAVDGLGESVSFIPVVCYSGSAEIMSKYVHKGNLIGVTGRLDQRAYKNAEGKEKSVIEVIVDNIQLLEKKPAEDTKETKKSKKK